MSLKSLRLVLLMASLASPRLAASSDKELGNNLKTRYKGASLSVMVAGFYAGEFKKSFAARTDFVNWHHYDESLLVEGGKAALDRVDDRTFATGPPLALEGLGSNTFPVQRGEVLVVTNTAYYCTKKLCTLSLNLDTRKLSRAAGLDPRKETTSGSVFESAGLGCAFFFHFSPAKLSGASAEDVVASVVGRYLLPSSQAEKVLTQEHNVSIEIGATEEEVTAKLGEPLKTVRVGSQKTLKYPDMTVILKDGKVADVKVE